MKTTMLSPDFLYECFTPDFINGSLFWNLDRPLKHFSSTRGHTNWRNKNPGKLAGHIDPNGYWALKITIEGMEYNLKQHRILYCMFHNTQEVPLIDHFDGDIQNNSISNLRPACFNLNAKNKVKSKLNKSGITGVRRRTDRELWVAHILINGRSLTKTTNDFFEACCFRKSWEIKLQYTQRHGREQH